MNTAEAVQITAAAQRVFSRTSNEELLDLMAFHKRSKAPYAEVRHAAARAEVVRRMESGR